MTGFGFLSCIIDPQLPFLSVAPAHRQKFPQKLMSSDLLVWILLFLFRIPISSSVFWKEKSLGLSILVMIRSDHDTRETQTQCSKRPTARQPTVKWGKWGIPHLTELARGCVGGDRPATLSAPRRGCRTKGPPVAEAGGDRAFSWPWRYQECVGP